MAHDEAVGGFGCHTCAEPRGRGHMPRELAMLEMCTLWVPDEPARRDRREKEPVAKAFVRRALRHMPRDEIADLLTRARRPCGEAEHVGVHAVQVVEQR